MVSDQEIAGCVESLLSAAGASGGDTSFSAVLRQAESKLGIDLSHKAPFIRDQIDMLLGPRRPPLHPSATPRPANPPAPPPPPPPANPYPPPAIPAQTPANPTPPPPVMPATVVTLPHPPPPAHLLFQPIPAGHVTGGMAPLTGGMIQGTGGVGQVPVAFYPPPPLAYRFHPGPGGGTYQVVPPQQQGLPGQQTPAGGSQEGDSKESGSTPAKRKRGGPGGLNKVCGVSPELQTIVGETAMSRTQIVKQLWAYIRQNNLQDPDDKRKIICNDQLKTLFGTDSTDMFKMNKLLAKHIIPLDSYEAEARKRRVAELAAGKAGSIPGGIVMISDRLAKFIGTDKKEMSQEDALKSVWDYIQANQLEDNTHTTVLCDTKLRELFGSDSIPSSVVSDILSQHFVTKP